MFVEKKPVACSATMESMFLLDNKLIYKSYSLHSAKPPSIELSSLKSSLLNPILTYT